MSRKEGMPMPSLPILLLSSAATHTKPDSVICILSRMISHLSGFLSHRLSIPAAFSK
jgi:hypothetical protein